MLIVNGFALHILGMQSKPTTCAILVQFETSASCSARLENYDRQTDRPSNRTTDRRTGHREVSLLLVIMYLANMKTESQN